ncbi:MAG: hypothetical protein JXB05_07430 [Myxococcaceae bacterium]|nr:hypothetical protein [Myxococcaceae bacterium]
MGRPAARLTPPWRRWLVENYVLGSSPEVLVRELSARGMAEAVAVEVVEAELKDPYVVGGRRATTMKIKLESLLDTYAELYGHSVPRGQVERRSAPPTREEFLEHYYLQNWPLVVEGALTDWPALQRWTIERFFSARSRLTRARRLSPSALRPLLEDIPPPRYAAPGGGRPSVWLCPAGATLPLSRGLRNVLLCQVLGSSRLRLLPSFLLQHTGSGPPHPLTARLGSPRLRRQGVRQCMLQPGHLLLLPTGWWHELRALEPAVYVTFEAFAAPEPNVSWR